MSKIIQWRKDPVLFVRDNFGIEPDLWQIDSLNLIGGEPQSRRRVAMKACTGPGKSAVLAWTAWYRLSCFGSIGQHPKGAALSGEGRDNLRDNLWAEIGKWGAKSKFLMSQFTWNKEQIYNNTHPETWFLSARSYPKDADPESIGRSLSGLHSEYPFILLDEIGDMPIQVGKKAEQIFTGGVKDALVIAAGNPTSTGGLLYDVSTSGRDSWKVITITADPDDPKRTPRVDIEHAREMIQRYGRNDPWVKATILGEFPEAGFNQLISINDVELACRRKLHSYDYENSQKRLGIDVALGGMDFTVIFPRQGLMSFNPVELRNARPSEIAARIISAKHKWGSEVEFLDDTGGFGSGVLDNMLQAGQPGFGINFSSRADNPRFYNKRAEMWFRMSEWIKRGACLPDHDRLKKELVAATYTFKGGRFIIEDKDLIKKRLGHSPDFADSLALTFATDESQTIAGDIGMLNRMRSESSQYAEYDPFTRPDKYNPFDSE